MARLRYNGLSTTLGGSLTNVATSVTFAAALTHSNGTNVPTIVSPDYIPLAILGATGHLSEIVYLTAYTAGATTGTITRGVEGTTGAAHSNGDALTQAPLAADIESVGGDYYRSGYYNHNIYTSTAATIVTLSNGIMVARPWVVPVRRSFDRIGVNITTLAASASFRFGIYTDIGGRPGTLLLDAGTVSAAATGAAEVTISQTLDAGTVWLAIVAQGTGSPIVTAYNSSNFAVPQVAVSTSPLSTVASQVCYFVSGATAALPSSPTWALTSGFPAVGLRAA